MIVLENDRFFYIGLTTEINDTKFSWRDLTVLGDKNYQNWENKKANPSGRKCVVIGRGETGSSSYLWKTNNCMKNASFICEKATIFKGKCAFTFYSRRPASFKISLLVEIADL